MALMMSRGTFVLGCLGTLVVTVTALSIAVPMAWQAIKRPPPPIDDSREIGDVVVSEAAEKLSLNKVTPKEADIYDITRLFPKDVCSAENLRLVLERGDGRGRYNERKMAASAGDIIDGVLQLKGALDKWTTAYYFHSITLFGLPVILECDEPGIDYERGGRKDSICRLFHPITHQVFINTLFFCNSSNLTQAGQHIKKLENYIKIKSEKAKQ